MGKRHQEYLFQRIMEIVGWADNDPVSVACALESLGVGTRLSRIVLESNVGTPQPNGSAEQLAEQLLFWMRACGVDPEKAATEVEVGVNCSLPKCGHLNVPAVKTPPKGLCFGPACKLKVCG